MTIREKDIIVGTILGDAHIAMLKTNARLEIVHSEKQKKYVFWKWHELQRWLLGKPFNSIISDSRYRKKYSQWRFHTKVNKVFTEFHQMFYKKSKKIIPRNIKDILKSPLMLAVWFMDDGGRRNDSYGLFLNTLSFTKTENNILRKCLKINFSLESSLHWIQDGFRIYIPSKDAKHFCELVYPYILPSMRYKLSYNPVTTSFAQLDRARDRK